MRYEWFIAKRYLRPQGGATFIFHLTLISMGGVAVGVAALITVLSVMNGFGNDLRAKILQGQSHILLRYPDGLSSYRPLIAKFSEVENVMASNPAVMNFGVLFPTDMGGSSRVVVEFVGIDPQYLPVKQGTEKSPITFQLIAGSLEGLSREINPQPISEEKIKLTEITKRVREQPRKTAGIIIGKELASALFGLGQYYGEKEGSKNEIYSHALGNRITLISIPENTESLTTDVTVHRQYIVEGVFETGHYDFDSSWVYISLPAAQSQLSMADEINTIQFWLNSYSEEKTEETWYKLYELNRQLVGMGYVETWMQSRRAFFEALKIEKRTMNYILKIIILVATFNIIATLFMVVTEKTRDIGLLRAVGAGRRNVLYIFLFLGVLVGAMGALMGVTGGYILCTIIQMFPPELPGEGRIYYLKYLPCEMEAWDFISVSLYTFAVSFLASIYPAVRASRLVPVEALRFS